MKKVRAENFIKFIGETFNVLDARYSIESIDSIVNRLMFGIAGEERNDLPDTFMFANSRLKLEFDLTAEALISSVNCVRISYVDKNQDAQNCFYIGEHLVISRVEGKFGYENGLGKINVSGTCGIFDEVYEFTICCVAKEFPAQEVWRV